MKKIAAAMLLLVTLTGLGCTGDKGKELYDTAQFEEKQHNLPHAVQLYEEIVKKYPGSEMANEAQKRLTVLKAGSGN